MTDDEEAKDPRRIAIGNSLRLMKEVNPLTRSKDPEVKLKAVDTYLNLLEFSLAIIESVGVDASGDVEGEDRLRNPLARRVRLRGNQI